MSFVTSARNTIYLRLIVPLAAALPAWLAWGLALFYADVRILLDRVRFKEVLMCLEQVMGSQLDSRTRREVARNYFRNRACMRVDAMRLTGDGHRLAQQVAIHGEEFIREALDEGKGVILCSAHYGSVRACAGLLGARGYAITIVAGWAFPRDRLPGKRERMYQFAWKPIEHHMRRANIMVYGTNIFVAVEAAEILRQNEVVFILLDTAPARKDQGRTISLDFLNGRVSVLPGAVTIAKLTGAPLLMAFLRRSRDWRHLVLEILPRTTITGDDTSTMQICMKRIEKMISQDPSQWELWRMRDLVRLGLYPEEKAVSYYKSANMRWEEL